MKAVLCVITFYHQLGHAQSEHYLRPWSRIRLEKVTLSSRYSPPFMDPEASLLCSQH
jgi:hypothetical protein